MNYKEAMAAIVQGDWVRHDAMQDGVYIAHSYSDGPRINFPSGSSSGWSPRDSDLNAVWSVCGPEVVLAPVEGAWVAPDVWAKREFIAIPPPLSIDFPNVATREQAEGVARFTAARDIQMLGRGLRPIDKAVGWGNPLPPAPNVGKWGLPPVKDKWGRPLTKPES